MESYQVLKPDFWSGRKDSNIKERFWQYVKPADIGNIDNLELDKNNLNIALLGFASDLGVLRNQGRIGASDGPNSIRKNLANLALDSNINIYDFGNIFCENNIDNLEEAQNHLGNVISIIIEKELFPIILGGGHETAYGHYLGLKKITNHKRVGIINFDAHFDLRELLKNNKGSSGTPFRQIYLDTKKNNIDFNYLCIGIQESANTKSLFQFAEDTDIDYILASEVYDNNLENIEDRVNNFICTVDYVYLTICLDVFSQSVAPGVSAPQAFGLMPYHVRDIIRIIKESNKIISSDIVELNPKYDIDNMTAKLAANLILDLI